MTIPPAIRRILPAVLKVAILGLVIWGGHRTITLAIDELSHHGWNFNRLHLGWAALAGVLYLASQFPPGCFWHGMMRALGQEVSLFRALRAYYIGHLGKYVPGKAIVVVMRAGMVAGPRMKSVMAVVAVFYETFITLGCGAAVAAILLLFISRDSPMLIFGSLAAAAVMTLPTLPPAFSRLLRITRVARSQPDLAAEPIYLPSRLLVRGWSTIAVGWVFAGASLWATLRAIGVTEIGLWSSLPMLTATIGLAVAVGFVSMLPAGLGVRDIVLLQLLVPTLEPLVGGEASVYAFVAVVVVRIVWLAAEVVLSVLLYPFGRRPAG